MNHGQEMLSKGFSRETLLGIFWAAVSVICWGTLFPVVSYVMKRGNIDPYTLSHIRFITAGAVMLAVMGIQKGFHALREEIGAKEIMLLVFHGIFAALMSLFLFKAQQLNLPVANASMLEAESPLLIFILGIVFLKNRPVFLQFLGLVLGFAGCMLVLKAFTAEGLQLLSFQTGDLLVFLGALFWAIYTILARKMVQKIGGYLYTSYTVLFAGLWIVLYQLTATDGIHYPTAWQDLCSSLYLALIPTALAFFSWNNAQRYISVGLLAISGYFTPMLAALLGALLFHEPITVCQALGMIIVIGSALIEPEISNGLQGYFLKKLR